MQMLDIVNDNDEIIGRDTRENIHKNGLLHREVHVWLYNKNGEIVFQKRAETKDTCPGLLDASVGAHVDSGEDYLSAAVREMKEETGLEIEAESLRYILQVRNESVDETTGVINNTIKKVYAYEYDGDVKELKVEEGMADGFEFWKIDRILSLNDEEKKKFIPSVSSGEYDEVLEKIMRLSN